MSNYLKLSPLFIAIYLTGCGALPQNIEMTEDHSKVASDEIKVTIQETPAFMFVTPKSAMTSTWFLVDIFVDTPTWQEVTDFNEVPDFTEQLRNHFIEAASNQSGYEFAIADRTEPMIDSEDFTRLTDAYTSPYILEFRTKSGVLGHGTLSWQTMLMSYFGDATLIRSSDGEPVWRASCQVKHSDADLLSFPAKDVFDGTGEEFRAAADHATFLCSQQLVNAFFTE